MKPPAWTIYAQKQEGKWMHTVHYFADTKEEAEAIYEKLKVSSYVAGYRPWTRDDLPYMGVLDRQEIGPETVSLCHAYRKAIDRSFL